MSELTAVQDDIIETFALLGDWAERYQYIIDLGRQARPFPKLGKLSATVSKAANRKSGS